MVVEEAEMRRRFVLLLVVPMVITGSVIGSGVSSSMGMFGTVILFVPEPNPMLLLGAAAAGLAVIGRGRWRPQ